VDTSALAAISILIERRAYKVIYLSIERDFMENMEKLPKKYIDNLTKALGPYVPKFVPDEVMQDVLGIAQEIYNLRLERGSLEDTVRQFEEGRDKWEQPHSK
jgi:hypothetical protein